MRRLWLCVPPALFALFDYVMTMRGQSTHYWSGDYTAVNEENPLVRWCMQQHPVVFHGLTFVWLAVFCIFILKLPRLLARMVSLAITFSHAFCAGTWFYYSPDGSETGVGFYAGLAICISSAVVFVIALELSCDASAERTSPDIPPYPGEKS